MKSETIPVQQVFQDRRQYLVPFYQRAYVWNKEEQWEPLWNDISDKADMRSKGDTPSPHFLGPSFWSRSPAVVFAVSKHIISSTDNRGLPRYNISWPR